MKRTALAISGLVLAFHPAFGGHKLNTHKWATCFPWSTTKGCTQGAAIDWYLPSAVKVSDGVLNLTATKKPAHDCPYTSGMVTTYKSFTFKYGYISINAKLPGGQGTWPALWLLPTSQVWPPEIDIMENHGAPHQISTTLHWATPLGDGAAAKNDNTVVNLTTSYNTYALKWTSTTITWYLDGKVIDSYTGPNVPKVPMYFLANLAIDGPAPSTSTFAIKSVRIYTNKR
jgi:beta-glucanase (GH16 family)